MRVKVRIESIHDDDEPIVAEYTGVWDDSDAGGKVRYGDGDALSIKEDRVIIDEAGEMKAHIVLCADDKVRETAFETAMGTMMFGIATHRLCILRTPERMMIETEYSLMVQDDEVSSVRMRISVIPDM